MQQLPYYPFITRGGPVKRKLTYDAVVYTNDGHYFAEDNNGHIFCQDSPTACIQEAVNYVFSKSTGGRVYIRAGDYYLAPLTSGQVVVSASIPYNAALIVEGDGDATRIHLPQNNSSANNQAWLFGWGWNGTAPYTRKSKLRNIAFINDVNMGSYSMNVLVTSASTNNSSGLEVGDVSVYDVQGTSLDFTFWINNLYDVTFSRYRFFSINSNPPNTAVLFDSVALGKIVDSFMYTVNGGSSAVSNGTGSIQVDSTEIYGNWQNAFNFGQTDSESNIDVTNSIIGINRTGSQGIQGLNNTAYGPTYLVFNSGNGIVKFSVMNSHILYPSINANSSTNNMYVLMRDNYIDGFLSIAYLNTSGGGYLYLDVEDNIFQGTVLQIFNPAININNASAVFSYSAVVKRNKFYLSSPNNPIIAPSSGSLVFEDNDVYISGTFLNSLLNNWSAVSGNGVCKIINNKFYFQMAPSSSTAFYLSYNQASSGTYYLPSSVIFKGNVFNLPTTNVTWGGFVGSAGATAANPNALFVDLDNTFNLSGINLPYPSVTTPAVPSSGTAQSNTYPYPVEAYVSGGSATAIQVTRGGSTYTVWSSSSATAIPPLLVRLEPGDSIILTYSTAPSWVWLPARFIP